MRAKQLFKVFFILMLLAGFTYTALAGPPEPPDKATDVPETSEVVLDGLNFTEITDVGQVSYAPNGQALLNEVEPNGTVATANALGGSNVTVLGTVYPNADEDYYSFTANAGDRFYAATMTSISSNGSSDSQLYLYDVDGTTLLEFDDDDGSMGGLSSSIAGRVLPSTGTYYLRVKHFSATNQLRPYHLHVQVQSGAPTPETEPNNAGQPLPASGWVSGDLSTVADVDIYTLTLSAGDTVFLSLDLDPERDAVEWNGWVGLGVFGGNYLVVNDAGTTTPDSEAFFMTVKDSGTYAVYISVPTGGTTFGTYHLSVSVQPAEAQSCTTYTSTDTPIATTDVGVIASNITIPGNPRVGDLNLTLDITHNLMNDLDMVLTSPAGNMSGLLTDVGSSTAGSFTTMNLGLDDEAGVTPLFQVTSGMVYAPELSYRLNWFDGVNAGGTWTLQIYDDLATNTGTLNSWSITVCDPVPPPVCPAGTVQTTLYTSDFEADDGGFTHSGTGDEWERGLPTFVPITTCNGGANCWKTDLDNTYNASNTQDLLSPNISLAGNYTSVWLTWAQKSQIESASFDHGTATVREVGGTNPRTLWQWLDATQTTTVGNPTVTIQESSGWGQFTANISEYIGQNVEVVYHLDGDATVQLTGLAIDDVAVMACELTDPTIDGTPTNQTSTQAPDTVITQTMMISNTGGLPLDWSIDEATSPSAQQDGPAAIRAGGICATPTDIPWVSTNPVSGTVSGLSSQPVDVAFDSTGLSAGVYTGTLCISSNDPVTPLVTVPLTLTVNQTAVPEPLVCNAVPVAFESGIPSDWAVVDNTGGTGIVWGTTADATCNIANLTNGSGEAACADSDAAGSGAPPYDTELVSNAFDLTGFNDVILDVAAYYNDLGVGNDLFQVDVWDGSTWTNELSWDEDHLPGDISLDLSAYGELSGVQVRFTYAGNGWDWYAEVDDVSLTCQNVAAPPVIEVSPDSLSSSQLPDTVITQTLTISNTGGSDLDWAIDEDDVSAPAIPESSPERLGVASPRTMTLAPELFLGPIVGDGGFEAGTPSPVWTESSTNFGTPLCTVAACGAGGGTGPHTGSWWAWFGGITSYEAGSVSQNVTIPNGTATLTFWLEVPVACDSAADYLEVLVDGTQVFLVDGTSALCGVVGYSLQTVDLSAYADGGLHALEFNSEIFATNGAITNFFVDDVAIDVSSPPLVCSLPSDLPWLSVNPITGTTTAGNSSAVDVTFDATGLSAGVYTGTLCITSNDPSNPLVTVPLTLTVISTPVYGVELSGDDGASGLPGDTVSYVVTITNTGNTTDIFDLMAAGVWTTLLSDANVTLNPGESTTFNVDVDIPAGAADGDSDVTTVTATSQNDASATDSVDLTTTATSVVYGVDLSGDDAASGLPGDTVSYVVTITNTGNTTDTFDLAAAGVWTTVLSDTSVTLGAGESTTFTVDVDIPANALEGESDVATVTATSQGDGTSTDTTLLTTSADAVYGVTLSGDDAASGAPGDTVSYVVTITNTGNTTDTFNLTAVGGWAVALSDTSVMLGAGDSMTFTVDVTIPIEAADGVSDATTVTATSQNDATATDSATLTTTAEVPPMEEYLIYLPIVIK